MKGACFPPIRDPNELPRNVLVLGAHPDDEVIGIGGLLAFHAERGDAVRVVHATDGAAGDPEGRHENVVGIRRAEAAAAAAALGLGVPESLGFPDGGLRDRFAELVTAVRALFRESRPALLYTFHGGEFHPDHRAVAEAACACREELEPGARILCFGVNQVPPFAALFEYGARLGKKEAALACFRSQLAYLDFATKVMQRDRAATVNVEIPEITHAECLLELAPGNWPAHIVHMEALRRDSEGEA